MDNEIGNCDNYYCELCSLDFTTRRVSSSFCKFFCRHDTLFSLALICRCISYILESSYHECLEDLSFMLFYCLQS